jgi:hypothetical protein
MSYRPSAGVAGSWSKSRAPFASARHATGWSGSRGPRRSPSAVSVSGPTGRSAHRCLRTPRRLRAVAVASTRPRRPRGRPLRLPTHPGREGVSSTRSLGASPSGGGWSSASVAGVVSAPTLLRLPFPLPHRRLEGASFPGAGSALAPSPLWRSHTRSPRTASRSNSLPARRSASWPRRSLRRGRGS